MLSSYIKLHDFRRLLCMNSCVQLILIPSQKHCVALSDHIMMAYAVIHQLNRGLQPLWFLQLRSPPKERFLLYRHVWPAISKHQGQPKWSMFCNFLFSVVLSDSSIHMAFHLSTSHQGFRGKYIFVGRFYYPRQVGYVFRGVCLFVCQQDYR